MTTMNMPGMDQKMMDCADTCQHCHATCIATITHCIQKGGKHVEPAHLAIMMDCAAACESAANFLLRGSDLHKRTCGVCAEACDRCAKDCERMGDDEMMKQCAEICRRCADSCRKMAA